MTMPRVEVITSVERRRHWSQEEKERLVAASLRPGVSVSDVARSAGLHVSQLFKWRKTLCERTEVSPLPLVPVKLEASAPAPTREADAPPPSSTVMSRGRKSGVIEIDLGGGRRVRVDRDVDKAALGRVIDVLVNR